MWKKVFVVVMAFLITAPCVGQSAFDFSPRKDKKMKKKSSEVSQRVSKTAVSAVDKTGTDQTVQLPQGVKVKLLTPEEAEKVQAEADAKEKPELVYAGTVRVKYSADKAE
ncbi:MAG TPA: hypothetical protein PLO78_02550 [Candidatus Omnitrophota bacterium]|nr:hypothetical protein [Candidatus Omnitrophota bacterium]